MYIKMQHKVELFHCVLPCHLAWTPGQPIPRKCGDRVNERLWDKKAGGFMTKYNRNPSCHRGILFWNSFSAVVNQKANPKTCKEKGVMEWLTFTREGIVSMRSNIRELKKGNNFLSSLILSNNHKFGHQKKKKKEKRQWQPYFGQSFSTETTAALILFQWYVPGEIQLHLWRSLASNYPVKWRPDFLLLGSSIWPNELCQYLCAKIN